MSLRINEKEFFTKIYRTRNLDTVTSQEQEESERAVEDLFRAFLQGQKTFAVKYDLKNWNITIIVVCL